MTINMGEWDRKWMGRRVTMPRRLVRTETKRGVYRWLPESVPVSGVVVGLRWLQISKREWAGIEDGGCCWQSHGTVPVVMIAESPVRKPVPVPLCDLEAEAQPWPHVEGLEFQSCA